MTTRVAPIAGPSKPHATKSRPLPLRNVRAAGNHRPLSTRGRGSASQVQALRGRFATCQPVFAIASESGVLSGSPFGSVRFALRNQPSATKCPPFGDHSRAS
jgi:hypothetical protein